MSTSVFLTIDTEFAWRHHSAGHDVADIHRRSIEPAGVGVTYKLERLKAHDLKACFFVDPMPALTFGLDIFKRTIDAILTAGRKGLAIQRYKGLGEMNAEQLWETTLDPSVRSMLRVTAVNAESANEIFTQLMGEVVEPRREFIQDNALNVANLDV